jgi:hypothetical protein
MAVVLIALVAGGSESFAASTGELLQQGLYAEEVEGNIDAAIKTYAQIIENRSAPAHHVAQALYRQGMCYLKLKNEPAARAALHRLVTEHPGQTEIVEKARPLLEDLTNFDPASLMPPGTLAYIEFGSPGRQVETILGTLKGTPYENPLAAVAGGQRQYNDQRSHGNIIGALLNPSMVTEFKKIRSSAVGVTGMSANHPHLIAVLYPGKSDALRGLIQAALGVAGKPGAPVEGMQTVNLPEDMAVAYDDRVFIMSRPVSQLQWCVKQYKGLISEPTLASSNKSFGKLDKAQRQKNALTVWANVDEAYAQVPRLFPAGKIPAGLLSANALVDFANIDNLMITDSVEPDGAASRLELQLKEGHHCVALDLIRTPNISRTALDAVPSQAVALASFSLSQSTAAQTDKVRTRLQNMTGLDVGREIFANVEQVVLFVMPAEGNSTRSVEELPGRVGLAVTSRNPEQTRQVLTTLLKTANPASAGQQNTATGPFRIGKAGDRDLYGFLDQVNATTILAFDRAVLDASVNSIKNRKSVLASGPLNGAVSKLPESASKLVLVNVGGAIRLVGPQVKPGELNGEQTESFYANLEQLACATEKTTIEVRTDEQTDSFAMNSCVTHLPPLNEVIGPGTQIARLAEQGRAEAKARELRQAAPVVVMPAAKAPAVDGNEDAAWSRATRYRLESKLEAFGSGEKPLPISSADDLSADFRTLWDDNNLYLLVDVTDDKVVGDTDRDNPIRLPSGSEATPWWYDDSIEVYLDADNAKASEYGEHDALIRFNLEPKPTARVYNRNVETQLEGVRFAMVKTEKGYRLEAAFPWSAFAAKPSAGATIGLDIHVNDDDNGGQRDHKIAWHDTSDNAWQSPQSFGNGLLGGLVGWWKFDESQGTTAKDSSGFNHDGTLVGNAKWSAGKIGGAVKLDGNGSFVRIADKSAFNMANEVTVAGWVNIHSVPSEWTAIATKGDNAWRLSTANQDRKFHFSVNDWDRISVNSSTTVDANTWRHVAAVHDGREAKLYVDGKLDSQQPWTNGIGRNNFDVLIGENAERKGRCFDGLIDDVRIYSYALTEGEIKALAASRPVAQ